MKEITPNKVLEAYKKIGYKPITHCFGYEDPETGEKLCCPVTALIKARKQKFPVDGGYGDQELAACKILRLEREYISGFLDGYDAGRMGRLFIKSHTGLYYDGFYTGVKVRAQLHKKYKDLV